MQCSNNKNTIKRKAEDPEVDGRPGLICTPTQEVKMKTDLPGHHDEDQKAHIKRPADLKGKCWKVPRKVPQQEAKRPYAELLFVIGIWGPYKVHSKSRK